MADINIGKRLRDARELKKLTQDQVAKEIGIAKYQTLSAYENGVNSPPLERLKQLAVLYEVTVDWILFGDEQRETKSEKEYMCQLVDVVDHFKLNITTGERQSTYGPPESIFLIDMGNLNLVCYDFLSKWYNLRKILDSGTIQKDLYELGLKSHIDKLPNDLIEVDPELPF